MAILNGINVKDAEFTAMQEKATAAICKQSFQKNKKFDSVKDIINDKDTVKELKEIFVKDRKQLFFYKKHFRHSLG